jgi:hypothetical protein
LFKLQKKYILMTVLLLLIEVFIAVYIHDNFIRPYVGDFLVVILIYCLIKSFLNITVSKAAISVLIFSYTIEILQYFNYAGLLGLEKYRLAYIILGHSFAWFDLVAYTLGIMLVIVLERVKFLKPAISEIEN